MILSGTHCTSTATHIVHINAMCQHSLCRQSTLYCFFILLVLVSLQYTSVNRIDVYVLTGIMFSCFLDGSTSLSVAIGVSVVSCFIIIIAIGAVVLLIWWKKVICVTNFFLQFSDVHISYCSQKQVGTTSLE